MDSFEFPALLLKAVVGKGWDCLLGSSLGSTEGSCLVAYLWGFTWGLCSDSGTRQQLSPASLGCRWLSESLPPAGPLDSGPDDDQVRRGLFYAL